MGLILSAADSESERPQRARINWKFSTILPDSESLEIEMLISGCDHGETKAAVAEFGFLTTTMQ
jgi:sulfite reductase beta subunit-like hemoprotein